MPLRLYNVVNDAAREKILREFQAVQRRHPQFSLRAWARRLGYRNPSYLSDVLSGRRTLTAKLATRLACSLPLSESTTAEINALLSRPTPQIRPPKQISENETLSFARSALDKFRLIADWYGLVVLEVLNLKSSSGFRQDIARSLRFKVSNTLLEKTLMRLERIGLARQIAPGRFERTDKATRYHIDAPNGDLAIRQYHGAMLEVSKVALETQDVSTRHFSGTVLSVKTTDLPLIRQKIEALHQFFANLEPAKSEGEVTYYLGTQFFRMDKSPHPKEEQ